MTGWKGSSRLTLDSQSIIGGMADIIVMPCWLLWRRYTASSDQRPARAHRDSDDPLLGQRTQPETVHEGGQEHHEQSYEGSHIPYTVSEQHEQTTANIWISFRGKQAELIVTNWSTAKLRWALFSKCFLGVFGSSVLPRLWWTAQAPSPVFSHRHR